MKWAYVVTDNDNKQRKKSAYEYDSSDEARAAGEEYVDKHKPSTEGGWSVTTSRQP
jgi:hypothetical protein